jgi:hypothetical protein
MRATTASLALASASLLFGGAQAWACECKQTTEEQAMASAEVAFHGKISEAVDSDDSSTVTVTVDVKHAYKGGKKIKPGASVEVTTSADTKACGVDFYVGRSYMIYADRRDGALFTTACAKTRKLRKPPVAPGRDHIAPVLPGPGDPVKRASRATGVFVAEVTAVGKGFSVSHDSIPVAVRVTQAIKGVKKRAKLDLVVDEVSCGRKKLSISQLDLDDPEPPVEVGQRYLFYTHSEEPFRIATCHDSILHEEDAAADLDALAAACGGRSCPDLTDGFDAPARLRREVSAQIVSATKDAIKTCAKSIPMFGKAGDFNELDLHVRVTAADDLSVAHANARGTITESAPYNQGVDCIVSEVAGWKLSEFAGGRVLVAMRFELTGKGKRPKFVDTHVEVRPEP